MKIIQVPFCFHPDPMGGTEVYVEALAQYLKERNIAVVIAAPGRHNETYSREELVIRRFAVEDAVSDPGDLYGSGDALAADAFCRILEEEQPDLVHLHAFTRATSLRLVREVKHRGIPVVFTYHTPTVSCQRGTLRRWGRETCDGMLRLDLCTRCTLHGLGVPRVLAEVVGRVPVSAGNLLAAAHLSGGAWTALRMRGLISMHHTAVRALMAEVDKIVAVSDWVRDLLKHNGVPSDKISFSRQGLAHRIYTKAPYTADLTSPVRMAFLGRFDPTKGVHVLIQAIRMASQLSLKLDIYGVGEDTGASYFQRLQTLARGDSRITFCQPIPSDEAARYLQNYDILAVPSQWLETGPLVVLEAFAAGIPVIGSKLGGIAELVEDGVNGLLVQPPNSPQAWYRQLQKLGRDREFLVRLRQGIRPPRDMATVADEMLVLYEKVLLAVRKEDS